MHGRKNTAITWATLVELICLAIVLAVGIYSLDLTGAVAAAVAIVAGRIVSTGLMLPPCAAVRRSDRMISGPVAPPVSETP